MAGPAGMEDSGCFPKDAVSPRVAEGWATVAGGEDKTAGFRKDIYAFRLGNGDIRRYGYCLEHDLDVDGRAYRTGRMG